MVSKTLAFGAAALVQLQTALAVPVGHSVDLPIHRRDNVTVAPPEKPIPIVHEIPNMTEKELQELIEEYDIHVDDVATRTVAPEPRAAGIAARAQGTEGALLTYITGEILPGASPDRCEDISLSGPFTSIHSFWGTTNPRGFTATSISGNTTDIQAGETIVDGGEFKFAQNERITKFSLAVFEGDVKGMSFETDAGNTYKAEASYVTEGKVTPTWEELNVGSGVLARVRGTKCTDIFGSFGIDFIDVIDSVSISNIDYSGFTDNIMPTGEGTEMSVGSQILDNRNSSVDQSIAITTTNAVTKQTTITSDLWISGGGKVAVEAGAGIPFVSQGKVTTEASWNIQKNSGEQDMENAITTKAGTFTLICPSGKFCTAKAFFTQFKMDVDINATFAATVKSGDVFNWVQSGRYKGADSLAMQFNVTEVTNVQ